MSEASFMNSPSKLDQLLKCLANQTAVPSVEGVDTSLFLNSIFMSNNTEEGPKPPKISKKQVTNAVQKNDDDVPQVSNDYKALWKNATAQNDCKGELVNEFTLAKSFLESGINGMSIANLRCACCEIVKTTSENLEIHILCEHLKWKPYQCPSCEERRASDNLMREHMFSAHGNTDTKLRFIYHDNPQAKKVLRAMMDHSLYAARNSSNNETVATPAPLLPTTNKNIVDDSKSREKKRKKVSVNNLLMNKMSKMDVDETSENDPSADINNFAQKLLAQIASTSDAPDSDMKSSDKADDDYLVLNDSTNNGYAQDIAQFNLDHIINNGRKGKEESSDVVDLSQSFLTNLTALLNNGPGSNTEEEASDGQSAKQHSGKFSTKKRVIGLCSKCDRPITSGSRQIHLFAHLAKDQSLFRFGCKFEDCDVENYRKDQLEAHLLKKHNCSDPNMIDDRSAALMNACQELSMELLGTASNNPGPTAALAQKIYDQEQKEASTATRKRRGKKDAPSLLAIESL
uniref:C2H2-type domain-containing protein n=1 Tax=Rhabditophanes sp. KR3021 TaxID=114890 RepID=A0AC35TJL4_9BILA